MTKAMTFFDTLLFSETMRESGMNEKTAKALAEELKKFREENTEAAKEEVLVQKNIVSTDINSLRGEMHQEFKSVRNEMHQEFKLVRSEIRNAVLATVISLGSIVAICSGVIIAFLK
jgi:ABC-type phosphate transport system auxiliary subunit